MPKIKDSQVTVFMSIHKYEKIISKGKLLTKYKMAFLRCKYETVRKKGNTSCICKKDSGKLSRCSHCNGLLCEDCILPTNVYCNDCIELLEDFDI